MQNSSFFFLLQDNLQNQEIWKKNRHTIFYFNLTGKKVKVTTYYSIEKNLVKMHFVKTKNIIFGFRNCPKIRWKESHWKKFRQNAHVHCAFQSKRSMGRLSAAAACARQARMTFYLKARNFNGKSFKLTFVSFVQSVFVQKNVI